MSRAPSSKKRKIPSAANALELLKEGNKRFAKDLPLSDPIHRSVRESRVDFQDPFAVILSCADSRVTPEWVFDTGLSDLFVVRVAGNIANDSTIASIEYACAVLGVNLVVVLGHEGCGAVKAAVQAADNKHYLNQLVAHIKPAIKRTKPSEASDPRKLSRVVRDNAKYAAGQLRERSPLLKRDTLDILPAYYDLGTGKVRFL